MEEKLGAIGLILKKYLAQIVIILLGLLILMTGLSTDLETGLKQNGLFTLGGIGLLLAGIISILYVAEIIKKTIHSVLMYAILPVLLVSYSFMLYDRSIMDELEYRNMVERTKRETVQRLKDLRDAEVEFKNKYGYFTANVDTLKWFIKEDKALDIRRFGDVPERIDIDMAKALGYKEIPEQMISEKEAWILMKKGFISEKEFGRDTSYQPVMEKLFLNDKAIGDRKSIYSFSLDSIDVAPYGRGKFIIKTGKIQKNGIDVPVFEIQEPMPLTKKTLTVGSLTEVSTNGNWGE